MAEGIELDMRKTIVFLGAVASASAFTASPAGLALRQPGPSAMATARPLLRKGATSVKMMDSAILDVLAAAPGIAALAALASREGALGGATAAAAPLFSHLSPLTPHPSIHTTHNPTP